MNKFTNETEKFSKYRELKFQDIEEKILPFDTTKKLKKWNLEELNEEEKIDVLNSEDLKYLYKESKNYIIVKDGNIISKELTDDFNSLQIYTQENNEVFDLILDNFDFEINTNKLNVLNDVMMNNLIYINVPKNVVIKEPLNIFVIGKDIKTYHTTFVCAQNSSNINIVEYITNNSVNSSFVTKFDVLENAIVNYLSFDNLRENSKGLVSKLGRVHKDATLNVSCALLGDGNLLLDNKIDLIEENASSTMKTLAVANNKTINLINSSIEHYAKNTTGFILNQGIVVDKSQITFNGIGKINNGMKQSNARQTTRGVVLDKEARLDANPFLLIDEFDVVASHGATIGKVDEEQLYYLMSRGLSKKEAEKLIVYGFLTPILNELNNEKIQEIFFEIIDKKIGK